MRNLYRVANRSRDTRHQQIPDVPDPRERHARIIAVRDSKANRKEPPMADPYIPLVTLAAELGTDATSLARRLDGAVQLDNVGLRVVSRRLAAQLIAEHAERRAEQQRRRAAWQQRCAEMDRAARSQLRGGRPAVSDSGLADLMAGDER